MKPTSRLIASALLGLPLLAGTALQAQRPATQDKTGQGAVEKQKPNPGEIKEAPGSSAATKSTEKAKAFEKTPGDQKSSEPKGDDESGEPTGRRGGKSGPPEKVAYDYELPGPDGKSMPLATYKGKTLLIVNLARNSSYNAQLTGLQKLSDQYKDKGLIVIGVPSDDFGAAEPGTDLEIQKVYKVDDKITFPITAKAALLGVKELPFYEFLGKAKVPEAAPVHWNYTKFLLDKSGKVVARFDPAVAPESPELLSAIEQVLAGRYKAPGSGAPPGGRRGGGEGGDPLAD